MNILNKSGMLTTTDRKEPLVHHTSSCIFTTCLDLSCGVKVTTFGNTDMTVSKYSTNVASFISYWTHFVSNDLNGFGGFSHVKFELVNFKIV